MIRLLRFVSLPIVLLATLPLVLSPDARAQAQTGVVVGTVVDADGTPIPGANVIVVGTERGSSTDVRGAYAIALAPGTYTVRASFVGFTTDERGGVEVAAGDTTEVDFTLRPDEVALEEVVVVGYGQQERRDLTGSVSSVDVAEIGKVATSSVEQALQGQVAGLEVTPTSGEPGAGAEIRIRGIGTLNDASPLYVVDGMLTDDISFLNPQDIQSIDVLKDASATAIYGSRGANGVVIITTQQGERGQETIFNLNVYRGWQEVMNPIELTNAREYATLANELLISEGQEPAFENPDALGEGTDWQDVVYRTAPVQNVQLSARGGADRIAYNFSGNLTREEGTIRKTDFLRASFRANNTYDLTDAVELGHNLAFTYRTGTATPGGIVGAAYRADPTVSPRNEDGEFSDASARASAGNPEASIFYHNNEYRGRRFVGNLYAEASFLDHFSFKSSFGLDLDARKERNFNPEYFVSSTQQNERSQLTVESVEQSSWLWENTLSYKRAFGSHAIDAVAGVTAQEYTEEVLGGRRVNLVGESRSLWYLDAGASDGQTNFNSASDWSMLSGLMRVNYAYLDRYLVTASFRADGSSRFGTENRFGYFPSFALGWRLSDEAFLHEVDLITNLKLRASWGQIGNDKIGPYPSVATVTSNMNAVFGSPEDLRFGATLADLANPQVRWEETTQTNIGLDVGILDDRLAASIDWYRRVTDGILVQVPIPLYVGVDAQPYVNAAEVLNTGIDAQLEWADSPSEAFSYRIGVTAATTHNEVLALGQGNEEILGGGLVNEIPFTTRTVVGGEIGAFYGYKVEGIYQNEAEIESSPSMPGVEPGDLKFADVNGDGEITSDDQTFIGSPIPDLIYGLNLSLNYRGFDVSASLNGQRGADVFNAKKAVRFGIENFERSYLDRWTGEGSTNSEPRVGNPSHNWFKASEWLLEDGDFLKIRNVQVGYTVPARWAETVGLQNLRFYANATNLVTFTKYSGYTPEISGSSVIADAIDNGVYPIARTVSVGVNATF